MKHKLKVLIEYECKLGELCPICIEEAIKAFEEDYVPAYRIKNVKVRLVKNERTRTRRKK